MTVKDTLDQRERTYGDYAGVAAAAQYLKDIVHTYWSRCNPAQRESLDMICNKIARIVNGDPNYADSWHDIAGYATLAERACAALTTDDLAAKCPEIRVGHISGLGLDIFRASWVATDGREHVAYGDTSEQARERAEGFVRDAGERARLDP
jgi:hypothetical protein